MYVQVESRESVEEINSVNTDVITEKVEFLPEDKKVFCIKCGNVIADSSDIIRKNGEDSGLFENPAGIFFRIICFVNAYGCGISGEYSGYNTWFPGYEWTIAFCNRCHTHLGWYYLSEENSFWGLIADRISGI